MNPLLEQFLQEARENLAYIDQNLESIGGDDPELLNAVFRAVHTLKGGSGIVGFESLKDITHHAEDLLDMLRAQKIAFREEMIEALYNAFDEVMNLVEAAEESEDVVDVDEEIVARIVAELNVFMGKESESSVWECPFVVVQASEVIINAPMPFLASLNASLPFELGTFDEAACSAPQLYAVVFDIDESCMVYGNDPVYALSLLGEKVIGMHTRMDADSAKSVLSGLDDTDGLLLKVQLNVFIYATYEEIEDALFNFADELQFLPLDIATLLGIDKGDSGHQLDLLKEFSSVVRGYLKSHNKTALSEEIAKSLQLVGSKTIQHYQLKRLSNLFGLLQSEELDKLKGFLSALENGVKFVVGEVPSSAVGEAEASPEASSEVADTLELDESALEGKTLILQQQVRLLGVTDDEAALKRVGAILEYLRGYSPSMPASFEDKAELLGWMQQELGIADVQVDDVYVEEKMEVKVEKKAEPEVPSVATAVQVQVTEAAPAKKREKADITDSSKSKETAKKGVIGKTVKIEQESIDHLMNIVGELLVAKNSLPYLADGVAGMSSEMIKRGIMEKYTFINRLAEQLQDLIMSMRMLPISYVFDRYPRLVRDISKNMGKKVKLTMEGGETKLDKNMIEMLADPLIHIMRNSLDHGIEAPDVREKKGKKAEGLITLNAYAQSDKIVIEIKDDGAGINVDKVVNKVLEKGLLSIEQIDTLSDNEKAELVLLPGLSTADEISEYSGRGVGMDVVKKSIENFGGTIGIKTVANQGTQITLSIPASLAVTSLLHVTMSAIHYGLPMDSVSETVKIEKAEIEYLHNEPFVYIRGEVIPLLFIESMLDRAALEERPLPVVVLNIKGNLLAVVVNELLGQLDVVQKPLEGVMAGHPVFSGTALLGNGQIIMAIDPLGLLGIAHVLKSNEQKVS